MTEFVNKHPIFTVLLGLAALGTIEAVLGRRPVVVVNGGGTSGGGGASHVSDEDLPVTMSGYGEGPPGYDGYSSEE